MWLQIIHSDDIFNQPEKNRIENLCFLVSNRFEH
jgi:hypothetical protein